MIQVIVFIFGLIVGSFLNCVIYRLETGKSFLKGRSFCPDCKHTLYWYDLIPVFSFAFLRGKCRYCSKKISIKYPVIEISTAMIFLSIFFVRRSPAFWRDEGGEFATIANLFFLYIIFAFLIIIFVYDLKHFIIPDRVLFPLIAITFIYQISNFQALFNFLLSAIFASLFFLMIYLITRGKGLGFGDVKLAFFLGLFLGFPNIVVSLFFAFFIGAIIGIALIILKKKNMKSEVPFGPFLLIGLLIAFFWGNLIIEWYLGLII